MKFFTLVPLLFIEIINATSAADHPLCAGDGRELQNEDEKIGGVIGESNPPADFLNSPYLETFEWTDTLQQHADGILSEIDAWMNNATSRQGALLIGSLSAVCNLNLVPDIWTWTDTRNNATHTRCEFWIPYLRKQTHMSSFFSDWLYYTPIPGPPTFSRNRFIRPINGPAYYIELYDFLASTLPGKELNFNNEEFADWMVRFLNIRGKWLQTPDSVAPYKDNNPQGVTAAEIWIDYTAGGQHPYDINDYIVPEPTFPDYNQIFLRNFKEGMRPVGDPDNEFGISSPCDGGIAMLDYGHVLGTRNAWVGNAEPASVDGGLTDTIKTSYEIVGKLGDTFNIVEAFPGYGTVVYANNFMGSHQYDFDNFDPNFPFGPKPAKGSNQVGCYNQMNKHRRFSIVIDAGPDIGLVGFLPLGFWGVGSIQVYIKEGDKLKRGDYIGHFMYGGSSIMLCFEPGKNFNWVGDRDNPTMIGNIQFPHQVKVRGLIGKVNIVIPPPPPPPLHTK